MQLFYPLGHPSEDIGIHKYLNTTKNQSYIPITGCILSHILSSKELSSQEKMYYILADSLSCINSSKGLNRSISLPAKSWAERLFCSKSEIFVLQKSLEDKGYFLIYRDKNDKGQNNRNTITTTIPTQVFNDLKYEPDRFDLGIADDIDDKVIDNSQSDNIDSIDKTFIPTLEGKRQHLEKTKMFIRVPYQFLKQLNSNCSISATSKVIMIYLFTKIYKFSVNKYDYDDSDSALTHNSYSIVISYQELQKELKLHRNSISKALKDLEYNNLINRYQIVIKSDDDYNSRADKSLWKISLLNVSRVTNHNNLHEQKGKEEQEEQIDQQQIVQSTTSTIIKTYDQASDVCINRALESLQEKGCTKYDPPCTDSGQLYIKNFVIKNSIIENIDANYLNYKNLSVDNSSETLQLKENAKKEFLENEQSSFPSVSYNNYFEDSIGAKQPCSNIHPKAVTRIIKNISENRYFYPLSEKDISTLNFRANREFSNNFVNQLLLKLYIKYPEKRFKNKFIFLSYMVKILANEKHQEPLVNHTSFRFGCNINAEEKDKLEYEKYLSAIEGSFDTSKEMQVRKKIAGRYGTETAYKILTQVEFKTNQYNSFVTALVPNSLDLSERQIEILSQQLEAVYGINGYYVDIVEDSEKELEKGEEPKTSNELAKGKK
ncbi:hypothetical protein REISMN_08335 (plasmid) [Rickettsia tamurae subsp. buchneri]|uniref:DnaA-like protein n=3 Tax=cellular organisms TaxID=131567 RepID=A0A8E1BZG6_9RICK|nr:hypothetical protein REISMN_08335 [Rickettsia tamurae subsp. buchneri]